MSDEDDLSGSDTALSCSPSTRLVMAGGSDLFKTVLGDYFLDESRISRVEYDRYKSKVGKKANDNVDHARSRRCDSCQSVLTHCKCDMYHGNEPKFGHRVHWADEVWEKPLTTLLDDTHLDDSELEPENHHMNGKLHTGRPKPILKHKATCIVIVSE